MIIIRLPARWAHGFLWWPRTGINNVVYGLVKYFGIIVLTVRNKVYCYYIIIIISIIILSPLSLPFVGLLLYRHYHYRIIIISSSSSISIFIIIIINIIIFSLSCCCCCRFKWCVIILIIMNIILYLRSSASANANSLDVSAPDILTEYWIGRITFGLLCVMFTFLSRIFYRGVPGFATDCPCGVWCRGLTTCFLYAGPLFGNLVEKDSRFVILTLEKQFFCCFWLFQIVIP